MRQSGNQSQFNVNALKTGNSFWSFLSYPFNPLPPSPPKKTLRIFYEFHFLSLLSDVTRVTDALPDDQKQVYEEIKNNKTIMDQAKKKVIAKYNGDIEAVRYSFIYFFIFFTKCDMVYATFLDFRIGL